MPSAHAQNLEFTKHPPAPARRMPAPGKDGQMLVQANEIDYDYTHSRVAAVGNVQIYYNQSMLEADKVIYDQKSKRLHAEGNVRITDAEGRVTHAMVLELTDDYRDGFIDSLRLETPDQTHMAAARADRTEGKYTVFQSGVYTACAPCKDNPRKPPLWQVKAARVIHDQGEKMLYFENARLEFFGTPIAYLPYFSTPDPTVRRKTGWLMPIGSNSSKYGFGLDLPYYWALAPNYDITLTPRITTRQGLLMQGEWRHRLINGAYDVRAYGINQADTSYFLRDDGTQTPGFRDNRGAIETNGEFALNKNWVWGWNGTLMSDRTFFQDYGLSSYRQPTNVFDNTPTEATSQLYLTGASGRSFFDIRAIHYLGFSESDRQKEIPVIHPVVDYSYVFDRPILGGELGYKVNFTSLSREQASFDAINAMAVTSGWCLPDSADPSKKTSANCVLRGAPGTYTRGSAIAQWRKSITDSAGQIWTPFVSLRTDVAVASIESQPGVNNFIAGGNTEVARVMPTVGMEYRYPFISVQSWGTQTIEPIAQVIVRPDEQRSAALPNEDAQSLTFSDANLFSLDRFSGWDRTEGGGRANVGVQATTQFNRGGTINVLFGQSYQLFGTNSFAIGDMVNTGLNSGLETQRSDYVGRISYQPNRTFTFTSRARLDEHTLDMQRLELESRANFERWSVSLLYGRYAAQPDLGLTQREGVLSTASLKVAANWVLNGGLRYDLDAKRFNQTMIGAGYVDDCFMLAMNYITDYSYSGNPQVDHRIMFQIGLRTLGSTSVSQHLGSPTATNGQ
ncbi:MAG: LPS-assembly protein LptD [Xanthobacteraceae bacterium]|nr:MAG: LPS-assembly protein LptD [Xanthobacteraceae bacterium]